jgi:Flp pilus assembly protein TadG
MQKVQAVQFKRPGSVLSVGHSSIRRGATVVEFALVVPIFFTLLFATIEFATLNTIRNTCNNAAYEAARVLVVPGAIAGDGITEAERILGIVGVDAMTVTVDPPFIDSDTQNVTVRVEVPYAENAILVPVFTGSVVLTSEFTLRTERYAGIPGP